MIKSWRPTDGWEHKRSEFFEHNQLIPPAHQTRQKDYEAGADAMHKADVDWLTRRLVERPATGKVRIVLDWQEWQEFTGNDR